MLGPEASSGTGFFLGQAIIQGQFPLDGLEQLLVHLFPGFLLEKGVQGRLDLENIQGNMIGPSENLGAQDIDVVDA